MTRIRIATRGSALALAQSGQVGRQFAELLGLEFELVSVKTTGDRVHDRPLAEIGGKGLFVKEIEEALLAGRADVAVHSAKDLPARLAPGLALAAFPERADPRDALVGAAPLSELGGGARVGTGSLRRTSQIRAQWPGLEIVPLRGNVDTRLRRVDEGRLDAVVLACAGLDRLGLGDRIVERVSPERLLPAVGQGALALEVRAGDPLGERIRELDHAPTRLAVRAERAFLARLEGDCNVPLAAFAELQPEGGLRVRGLVASPDGSRTVRVDVEGEPSEAEQTGRRAAEAVLAEGGGEILAALARGAHR